MIKIWYTDFWGGWDPYNNWFSRMFLDGNVEYIIDPNPDVLIYSCFGHSHKNYNCKKIYWTGENTRPPLGDCDLALGFDYIDNPKYMRTPLYAIHYWNIVNEWKAPYKIDFGPVNRANEKEFDNFLLRQKNPPAHEHFCAFIYGNASTGMNHWGNIQDGVDKRIRMFNKLNAHKPVHSLGSALNNTGIRVAPEIPKIECIRKYKFTFAIENSSYPGYVTEKIIDPMVAHSIPIYWGSPDIKKDFTGGYINLHEMDEDDAVEYILALDSDPKLYEELYYQPYMDNMSMYFDFEIYRTRIKQICE